MKKYPEYKDSGIEWLESVPSNWEILRLKTLIFRSTNGVWGSEPDDSENDLVCVRVADFDMDKFGVSEEKLTTRNIPSSQQNGRLLSKENLLIEKSGGGEKQTVGRVIKYDLDIPAVCSNFIAKIDCNKSVDPKFLVYLFSYLYSVGVNTRSIKQTTGIQNLDTGLYFNEKVTVPPSSEQTTIANFLDHKTQQIDDLIERKKRLIELLKEERTAVINQAVTKGLDSNVPMKDSGIEWLGKIPEHWEVKRLKYVVNINQEALPETTDENFEFSYIDIGNVSFGRLNNEPVLLTFKDAPSRARRIVHSGDTIISTVRTYLKAITFINDDLNNNIVSTGFAVLTPISISDKFIFYIATSDVFVETVCAISVGVSYPATNASDIGNIQIWLPPHQEQEEISKFIEDENCRIEYLINQYNRQVELLLEYKTSLINEAVTGKITVTDAP